MVLENGRAELNRLSCTQMIYFSECGHYSESQKQLASVVSEEVKGSCGAH